MRFLVTGGTGFIGSHIVEAILKRGWDAICLVRDPYNLRHLSGLPVVACSMDGLSDVVLRGGPLDYVIHLGGVTRARDYEQYRRVNVQWTGELLGLCADGRLGPLPKRFVLVSSQSAAGPSDDSGRPVEETRPPCPVSLYGRSKLEAEETAAAYTERLPITIIRPPTVFGPRDRDVLNVFLWARRGIAAYIAGRARLVSIVYVEDLVQGILHAAMAPQAVGETYFLANREPVVWREFCLLVGEVLEKKVYEVAVPVTALKIAALAGDVVNKLTGSTPLMRTEKLEEMRQMAWVCSGEKAFRELGWEPPTPLREAVARTAAWYIERGWI